MSKASIPKTIVKNRREEINKYAPKYNLTPAILAEFFQVPIKVIERDLVEGEITLSEDGLKKFDINSKKTKILNSVNKACKNGRIEQSVLAEKGFWTKPIRFDYEHRDMFLNIETRKKTETSEEKRTRMRKSYAMMLLGFTVADVRIICRTERAEIEMIKNMIQRVTPDISFQKWALDQYGNRKSGNVDAKDIAVTVGVSAEKLRKGDKYYYDALKKQGKKPATLKEPKCSKEKRNELKEKIYHIWKSENITQKELAEEYLKESKGTLKSKRVTIGNWIREMKAQETDDIYSLSWRRNTSDKGRKKSDKKKAKRRENCLNKIRPLIDEGASLNQMRKLTGHSAETIKNYMKDAGLWEGYLEKRPELKR